MNRSTTPSLSAAAPRELAGRHMVVIGLGESGLAMARWGVRQGARVTVADDRAVPPNAARLAERAPGARLVTTALVPAALDAFEQADLIAWSPGLSAQTGPTAALWQAAQAAGLPVVGELDLFADELARRAAEGYAPKVVAITGTNGKTTVTELVGHLAKQAGVDVQMAGNISPALLDALADRIDAGQLPALWALELSSFQLATAAPLPCTASVILNLSEDHLDWHGTMAACRAAKLRIHARSACRIANGDDRLTDPAWAVGEAGDGGVAGNPGDAAAAGNPADGNLAGAAAPGRRGPRPKTRKVAPPAPADSLFLLGEPKSAPAFGIVRDGGLAWLVEALAADDGGGRRRREPGDYRLNRLMPVDALPLAGEHNRANVLAALALLRAAGLSMGPLLRGLRDFRVGPHRCQPVATIADVTWYNDSKGTNVGATVAALAGLGRPTVLIAGGVGKGQDFSPLGPAVRRHGRAVVLIGQDAPTIRAVLEPAGVPIEPASDMDGAVATAARLAQPGDAVLLSPACASFDMFRNYGHRGDVFTAAVRARADAAQQDAAQEGSAAEEACCADTATCDAGDAEGGR